MKTLPSLAAIVRRMAPSGLHFVCVLMALASCRCSCDSLRSEKKKPFPFGSNAQVVVFDLARAAPEQPGGAGITLSEHAPSFSGTVLAAQAVMAQDSTRGIFLRFGSTHLAFAQIEELGRLFQQARGAGIPVYCHADGLDNGTLWLAARACDETWLSPAGGVDAIGIAGQAVYLAGLLERIDVSAEFLHVGEYKSAGEMFTRSGPSEPAIESMRALLASQRAHWRDGIVTAKNKPELAQTIELGPYDAQAARSLGLVEQVGYESEARAALTERLSLDRFVSPSQALGQQESAGDLSMLVHLLLGDDEETTEPHIAVLPVQGAIAMGESSPLGDGGIFLGELRRTLTRLREDDSVRAVVLRIESPGGSALASDLLWHEILRLRGEKPVVASLGSVAASGGYYLACAGSEVVSEATSLIGSIGVVGGKFTFSEALADLGISVHTFAASEAPGAAERATYGSLLTPWDEGTRERVRQHMATTYELFLERVAMGRKMTPDDVRVVAEGRVWSGAQGRENGLVDHLGGLELAIERARSLASLPPDVPARVFSTVPSLLELFGLRDDEGADGQAEGALLRRLAVRPSLLQLLSPAQRAFLASFSPLAGPETVVTSLPFVLESK